MPIWKREFQFDQINSYLGGCAKGMGIKFVGAGDDYLTTTIEVRADHHQPMGILHGGISCVLAETVGSVAANLCAEEGKAAVGMNITASHIRKVQSGLITATAKPRHIGRTSQVWDIQLSRDDSKLFCSVQFTVSVISISK